MKLDKLIVFAILTSLFLTPGMFMIDGKWLQLTDLISAIVLIIFIAKTLLRGKLSNPRFVPYFIWFFLFAFSYFSIVSFAYLATGEIELMWFLIPVKIALMFNIYVYLIKTLNKGNVGVRYVYKIFVFIASIQLLYMGYQFASKHFTGFYFVGVLGTIGPSHAGFVVAMLLSFFLSYYLQFEKKLLIHIFISLLFLMLLLIINRSSIVAGVTVCALSALLYFSRLNRRQLITDIVIFSIVFLVFIVFFINFESVLSVEGMPRIDRLLNFFSGGVSDSSGERVDKWYQHLSALHDKGYFYDLFGAGSNAQLIFTNIFGDSTPTGAGVDNLFIRIIWNFGYIGLLIFLSYLLSHVLYIIAHRKNFLLLFTFTVMIVHNITHELYFIGKTIDIFIVFTALSMYFGNRQYVQLKTN